MAIAIVIAMAMTTYYRYCYSKVFWLMFIIIIVVSIVYYYSVVDFNEDDDLTSISLLFGVIIISHQYSY